MLMPPTSDRDESSRHESIERNEPVPPSATERDDATGIEEGSREGGGGIDMAAAAAAIAEGVVAEDAPAPSRPAPSLWAPTGSRACCDDCPYEDADAWLTDAARARSTEP